MKVYFISGMAADSRVFRYIQLPEGFEAVFLDWITPGEGESLASYALRLAQRIDTSQPFVVVGLSFGGMLATEIAKHYTPAATCLISSIPVSSHLPRYFRTAARLNLHKIVPVSFIKTSAAAKRFFTDEKPEDKKLLWQIIRDSDTRFIRWSMQAVLSWQNETVPQPIWHIHGDRDDILPVKYTRPTHTVSKAGHLMVMSQPEPVNDWLRNVLLSIKYN
jgi:Predicted hydrolases or acyltransferases (alpha/beta hydrolase superfamily)